MPVWVQVAIGAFVDLLPLAFFAGVIWTKLGGVEGQLRGLVDARLQSNREDGALAVELRNIQEMRQASATNRERLAILENDMTMVRGQIEWGTQRFQEAFRAIYELNQGRSIPGWRPETPKS